jgi:hypothetical protein
MNISYNDKELAKVQGRRARIAELRPRYSEWRVKVQEVISRLQGENGLSAHNVDFLTSAILALNDDAHTYTDPYGEMGKPISHGSI